MSYILDALRKSEQERQISAGQNSAMLSPIEIQPERNQWLLPSLLIGAIIMASCLAAWWLWPNHTLQEVTPLQPAIAPPAAATTQRPTILPATSQPSVVASQIHTQNHPTPQPAHASPPITKSAPSAVAATPPPAPTPEASRDPLQGMPALDISGYVHDAQSGSLAMINNQLVHEGEEVAPGLRLVKILEDSAIFSYKGYIFTR
jgi:general secretion pathway protein B